MLDIRQTDKQTATYGYYTMYIIYTIWGYTSTV